MTQQTTFIKYQHFIKYNYLYYVNYSSKTLKLLRRSKFNTKMNKKSIKLGEKIKKLILNISNTTHQIQILSSTAPRASQTAENIVKWLWTNNKVHTLDSLWDDDINTENFQKILTFIKSLPPHLALIIVTHLPLAFPIAQWLWYKWKYKKLWKLWYYFFEA